MCAYLLYCINDEMQVFEISGMQPVKYSDSGQLEK